MPEIALLTLANHVEVQNGLLYMNGGGWDTLTRTYNEGRKPDANLISIALATLVHWDEANEKHQLTIWVEDEDGGSRLIQWQLDVEVGRPPGRTPGSDSRSALALNATIAFPHEGGYRVVAEVGEARHQQTYPFRVVDQVTSAT